RAPLEVTLVTTLATQAAPINPNSPRFQAEAFLMLMHNLTVRFAVRMFGRCQKRVKPFPREPRASFGSVQPTRLGLRAEVRRLPRSGLHRLRAVPAGVAAWDRLQKLSSTLRRRLEP